MWKRFLNRRNSHQQRDPSVMHRVLPPAFFQRPAGKVARDLLGKHLVRMRGAMETTSIVIETEAYKGTHDLEHFYVWWNRVGIPAELDL